MHQYKELWDKYLSKLLIATWMRNQPQVHKDDLLRAKKEVEEAKEAYKKSLTNSSYCFKAVIQLDGSQKETLLFQQEQDAIEYLTMDEDPEDWYEKDCEGGPPPPFGFMQEIRYQITCMNEVRYVIKQYLA